MKGRLRLQEHQSILKRTFLTLGLSAALLAGCYKDDDEYKIQNQNAKQTTNPKKPQKSQYTRLKELTDSLKTEYGFNQAEYDARCDTLKKLEYELNEGIDSQNHKWVELAQKADTSNKAIAQKHTYLYIHQASAILAKYKLSVPETNQSKDYTQDYVNFDDGKYTKQFFIRYMKQWHQQALRTVETSIYSYARQKDICAKLQALYDKERQKTETEQTAARHKIEQKYIRYYPALADSSTDLYGYIETKHKLPHYIRSYIPLHQYLVGYETVQVYAKGLSIDFFKQQDAEYTLKEIKPNRWQVEKVLSNGQKSKTKIFECDPERIKYERGFDCLEDADLEDYFAFKAGSQTGVHIMAQKITYTKSGQNDARWSQEEVAQKKQHLETQIKLLKGRIEQMNQAENRAQKDAKSILKKENKQKKQANTANLTALNNSGR